MKPYRPHHQQIWKILSHFDAEYLAQHAILFGGGTRIALELDEFRESVDIDFFCATSDAYRTVRLAIGPTSLGPLLLPGKEMTFAREIRADRDAVRTFVSLEGCRPIKLEFIHFDSYKFVKDSRDSLFPVPSIDRASCYLAKLLANADRYADPLHKDIFDLCMMHHHWGPIPESAWHQAAEKYGAHVIHQGLLHALNRLIDDKDQACYVAENSLHIEAGQAKTIVDVLAPALLLAIRSYS